jgi:hypothetical protein
VADSAVQLAVERWICSVHLPERFGQAFTKQRLPLAWGALFEYDAVSEDRRIVAVISTSKLMTAGGKQGAGKKHKILADLALLFGSSCENRLAIFTEPCMWRWASGQKAKGRVAPNIEIVLVDIPEVDRTRLESSRLIASNEVSPTLVPKL